MIEIKRKRGRVVVKEYYRKFNDKLHPGHGFQFTCDKDYNLIFRTYEDGTTNEEYVLRKIAELENDDNYEDLGNCGTSYSYIEPSIGICKCGADVVLSDPLDNYCENSNCDLCYNMSGQLVYNSRSSLVEEPYWPEEGIAGLSDYDDLW